MTGVRLRDTVTGEVSELEADGFFVAIGHDPNTALFLDQLDHEAETGYLITQRHERPRRTSQASSPPATSRITSTVRRSPRPDPAVPRRSTPSGSSPPNGSAGPARCEDRLSRQRGQCRTTSARTARSAPSTRDGREGSPRRRPRAAAAASASCSSSSDDYYPAPDGRPRRLRPRTGAILAAGSRRLRADRFPGRRPARAGGRPGVRSHGLRRRARPDRPLARVGRPPAQRADDAAHPRRRSRSLSSPTSSPRSTTTADCSSRCARVSAG